MNVCVGNTDWNWFRFLRSHRLAEVSFWKSCGEAFKSIAKGDLFLFKPKTSHGGKIADGGFFVDAPITSID